MRHARSGSLPNFSDEATITIHYNDGDPEEFTADIETLVWLRLVLKLRGKLHQVEHERVSV